MPQLGAHFTCGVPHYNSIIDSPMDLGSIKHGLDHGFYSDPNVVAADLRLVFRNAMTFNVALLDVSSNCSSSATR